MPKTNHLLKCLSVLATCTLAINVALAQVTVDPPSELETSRKWQWDTAMNTQNWVVGETWSSFNATTTGLIVQSGNQAIGGSKLSIETRNISNSPDLNLGYNDFFDITVAIPSSFQGSLVLSFGVTGFPSSQAGFPSSQTLVVPNTKLNKDGIAHTYRLDMGLVPLWRGTLSDLRITMDGTAPNQTFIFKKIVVGDQPGNNYVRRDSLEFPNPPPSGYLMRESKHFRINSPFGYRNWSREYVSLQVMLPSILRNLEECWQVYFKKLGYREPCFPTNSSNGTVKYKINVKINDYGAFSIKEDDAIHGGSFAWINIYPEALRTDPPSWVLPHELMHVFQMHNQVNAGNWFEPHAEYGMERWLEHYAALFPVESGIPNCSLTAEALFDANLGIFRARSMYFTWPLFYYLDTNPDMLGGLGEGTMVRILQSVPPNTSPYNTLGNLTQTSLKDIIGLYARRMVTLDFPARQIAMKNAVGASLEKSYTELECVPDNPGWWRCPQEKAPVQGGYTIHPITPTASTVTVNFLGLRNSAIGADWRASIVVVKTTGTNIGKASYSTLWRDGEKSMPVEITDKVYLVVAATPDQFFLSDWYEPQFPYRSHPSKVRFHYEVKITGGTPLESTNDSTSGLTQHPNGGGWKSPESTVANTAYVGPNARVLGNAQILGMARVEDYAIVKDHATVMDNATVSGHALVGDFANVKENARVRDQAKVFGQISGNSRILQRAEIQAGATFKDVASARGMSFVEGGVLSGGATLDGDYTGNDSSNTGFAFGYDFFDENQYQPFYTAPDRILAAYDFNENYNTSAIDSHGALTAFLRGGPVWSNSDVSDTRRTKFLTFNGISQWVALDRALADVREFSFTAWIKPQGGGTNQAVLWMGTSGSRRMVFIPKDPSNKAVFAIRNGGGDMKLTSNPLPDNQWSHVAITLNGSWGILYINGRPVASRQISIRPDQLLAPNDLASPQQNYLARAQQNVNLPMFKGSLDSVRFYSKALTAQEVNDLCSSGQ